MVAVDHYNTKERASPFFGVLSPFALDLLRSLREAPKYLFRRTDAEIQRRWLRDSERISAMAGGPSAPPRAEARRLGSAAILSRLALAADDTEFVADQTEIATHCAIRRLDRVDYELAAIRAEIAPYILGAVEAPEKTVRPQRI